jgi:hypothetical protein
MGGGAGVAAALFAHQQARIGGPQPSLSAARCGFPRAHWAIPLAAELGEEPGLAGLALTA